MDIDGVVIRDPDLIPGSLEAVQMLRQAGVPFAFMTNGGGVLEKVKAAQLAALLKDDEIDESGVILSHTPMRHLAEHYKGRRVLILGSKDYLSVARAYGFDVDGGMAVTAAQIIAGTPDIYSRDFRYEDGLSPVNVNANGIPIEAIIILNSTSDWAAELQVATYVLAGGRPLGCGGDPKSGHLRQAAKVFCSNSDFVWQAKYPAVRYGQGAFLQCLRALWLQYSGQELCVTEFGKPQRVQFDTAHRIMKAKWASLRRLYMIGDNPATDIRGANQAGELWRSILVCTGVYRGGPLENDLVDPAWRVEKDLRCAVERLLSNTTEKHLGA